MTETNRPLARATDGSPEDEAEPAESEAEPAESTPVGPARGRRLAGVDLARAIAVFGMFAVHVGPDPANAPGALRPLLHIFQGRSSALFATLAGMSLVLVSGRRHPKTGMEGRRVRVRLATRAVILIVLGTGLTMLGTHISVIVPYYGVYFLLALPLLRLGARALAVAAVLVAVAGPFLTFAPMVIPEAWLDAFAVCDPVNALDGRGFIDLAFVGAYPAATWMSYVIAGMALGRIDLEAASVRRRLAVLGCGLAVAGYGGSWLAVRIFHAVTGLDVAAASGGSDTTPGGAAAGGTVSAAGHDGSFAERLLTASPHSGSTFEQVGNTGVAVLVVVLSVASLVALPRLRTLARPVIALGTMSLSAYVAHILAIRFVDVEGMVGSTVAALAVLVVVTTVFAGLWSRFFRRGPLEGLLHVASAWPARLIR